MKRTTQATRALRVPTALVAALALLVLPVAGLAQTLINVSFQGTANYNTFVAAGTDWANAASRGTASSVAPIQYTGTTWNNNNQAGTAIANLVNSDGSSSGIALSKSYLNFSSVAQDWFGFYKSGVGTNYLCHGMVSLGRALGGNFMGVWRPFITLSNLATNHTYNVTFAGEVDAGASKLGGAPNNGAVSWFKYGQQVGSYTNSYVGTNDWYVGQNYVTLTGLIPRANGTITIQSMADTTPGYTYYNHGVVNAMQVRDNGVNPSPNTLAEIVALGSAAQNIWASISGTSITLTMPYDAVLTSFAPDFELSVGATCTPAQGVPQDFSTGPVTYTVVAQDGVTTTHYQVAVTKSAYPVTINVNYIAKGNYPMNGMYSMNVTNRLGFVLPNGDIATQAAPAAYNGNVWNDINSGNAVNVTGGSPGVNGLLDSTNGFTGIGLSTLNMPSGAPDWCAGIGLEMGGGCVGSAVAFTGYSNIVVLSSLPTDHRYDLYVGSQYQWNAKTTSFKIGTTVQTLALTTSSYNCMSWAEGTNYVHFAGVQPQTDGTITLSASNNAANWVVNGFQIVDDGVYTAPSTNAFIESFSFPDLGDAAILGTNISLTVPHGTVVTSLAPSYTVSPFAAGTPASGTALNFSTPQTYTVVAQDGVHSNIYSAMVNVAPAGSNATMLTFGSTSLNLWGRFNGLNITLVLPPGTVLTSFAPDYTLYKDPLAGYATCTPATGVAQDFSRGPVAYTVVSEDGLHTNVYAASVTVGADGPAVINVNYAGGANPGNAWMNGIYAFDVVASGSANRSAPLYYGGTIWNDFNMPNATTTDLLDSKGGSTGIGLTTTMQGGPWNDWFGLGNNRMLVSGVISGYATYTPCFTLTGLSTGSTYDLYIANCQSLLNRDTWYRVGTVEKHVTNPYGTAVTDWVEGTNYVYFAGLAPDSSGTLTVEGMGGQVTLNGFQLTQAGAASSAPTPTISGITGPDVSGNFTIAGIADKNGTVTLWTSPDVARPLSQWTQVDSKSVTGGVPFSFTVSQGAETKAFFRLMGP